MSTDKVENVPLLAFIIPGVVCCIVILASRHWLNAFERNLTTTAFSRRRKIFKDPLVKRPVPIPACAMLPPSKKSNGNKKGGGNNHVLDDDNHSKRKGKSNAFSAQTVKPTETIVHPKHMPFPLISRDGELQYEAMTFMFMSVALALQLLNLYRTEWWMPESTSTTVVMFELIDPHLVTFILLLLSRRLLYSLTITGLQAMWGSTMPSYVSYTVRMFVLGVILGGLGSCSYYLLFKHPLLNMFYLCYPAIIYLLLFGFQVRPFLSIDNEFPAMHACSMDPVYIREEIEKLREHCNYRIKNIIFSSVVAAYYTSFIPCCFAQSILYYDVYYASAQTAFVWGAVCLRLTTHLLGSHYCDILHRATLHLGIWIPDAGSSTGEVSPWSPSKLYGRGSRVTSQRVTSVCGSQCAAADPASHTHRRFHAVFRNPSTLLCGLVTTQIVLIFVQIILLFCNLHWHFTISLFTLLFINYYSVFKLVRDYLISWRVYKAEYVIQEKPFENQSN